MVQDIYPAPSYAICRERSQPLPAFKIHFSEEGASNNLSVPKRGLGTRLLARIYFLNVEAMSFRTCFGISSDAETGSA